MSGGGLRKNLPLFRQAHFFSHGPDFFMILDEDLLEFGGRLVIGDIREIL